MTTTTEHMRAVMSVLDETFNPGLSGEQRTIGIALLIYDMNVGPDGGKVNYVGNGRREDVHKALKELVARWDGERPQAGTQDPAR
jgi:hypothetical protein